LLAVIIFAVISLASALTPKAQPSSSSHKTVLKYQAFLQHQGYDPGPINGIIGSKTIAAIQQYITDAETGDRTAQYHVATFYTQGIGVPKDSVEAAMWYRRAAERGLNEAQYQLGLMYLEGNGFLTDLVRAYAWSYVAVQGSNRNAKWLLLQLKDRLLPNQRKQALELGKKLFAVCGTSMAQ
jgi:TPR repeat protein